MTIEWAILPDRELRVPAAETWTPARVVACVNIWNDLPALQQTCEAWRGFVDHVIVLDGRYDTQEASRDGLREWVEEQGFEYHHYPWSDQNAKRSFFFRVTRDGDLLFIVDADEQVTNLAALREPQTGDVGWVNLTNPIYRRVQKQPRLLRWQEGLTYRGRHHWIYVENQRPDGGSNFRLLTTHQYAGPGFRNYLTPIWMMNDRGLGRTSLRIIQRNEIVAAQATRERNLTALSPTSDNTTQGREPLRVLQWCKYDPGLVAFRLHTAINTTTPNESALIRATLPDGNPFLGPTQFDAADGRYSQTMRELLESADVLHCHLDYRMLEEARYRGWKSPETVVIHHHGSMLRDAVEWYSVKDAQLASLRLVSNFDLLQYSPGAKWLPNPVPVGHYRALRDLVYVERARPLVIGHSPSKPAIKGTAILADVVDRLRKEGYQIELDLIIGVPHEEAVRRKTRCDLFFDSFWLGIQCSGVEAGAMGIPVVAGDPYVRDQYVKQIGHCPYVYADGQDDRERFDVLFEELRKLVTDAEYRVAWAKITSDYVLNYHDDAAVALRYLDLLDEAVGWRRQLALYTPDGREQTPVVRRPIPTRAMVTA